MKILVILLIPSFWGIVSATPSSKGINLVKDELQNLDNQQNQNKNLDLGAAVPDKQKSEQDATRNELRKQSLFPSSQKDHVSSPDKEKIDDTVKPKNIILNGFELGRKLIDRIVQSILKIIHKFNSDISKNKLHNIQKRENTKPRNVIVKYKKDERLKNTFNLKNARKRKIIDQEVLHSIIPQITVNNNQRSSISRYNERLKKTDNNGYKTKRRQLYSEAHNVQRNKRGIHTLLCNTLNKDNKNCPHNTDAVVKKEKTSIVGSLNSGPAHTNIIQKINAEAAKLNEFQMSASDSEFSKWLDNTPEYYFDYSEPLDISPKYTPIATNIKVKSAKTALDKTPDKSAPIKTYFQPNYEDSHSKWTNDKEFEYYTDLKKSPITWHGYSTADETIPLPSEWDIIDKTTNDNKNVKSNTNSISKATVSEITNFEPNNKHIDIPSDWIANYKVMKDKSNDILFFKVGLHTGDNPRTGVVREDANKSLKTVLDAKRRSDEDDNVSKTVESTSIATTSKTAAVSESHQKSSTLIVNDTIVNNKNNTAVAAESATLTKYSAEGVGINEYKEKQANSNIITAIVSDKNVSISDDKAAASHSVNSTLSVFSKNENELSQYSVKNNSNFTKVQEVILSKAVSSGTGLAYSTENSDPYKIDVPSEWIAKYKSLGDRDYYSKLVISGNSNVNNSATTGDSYKPTNWTNEPKVTREPDDKWPSLEANAKTSAVQAIAVSTEKIENLLNKKNEETKVLSLKDLTEKDKTTTSVTANSNLNESTVKKQTSSNSSEDKKLLSTEDNKVVGSTTVDAKTALINDNNKQKWESDNNDKILNVNSQLVASPAGNTKVATTSESEKIQWKGNDESKNWIVKNDTISDNKVTVSVEANAYATAATNNNNQTLTLKNNFTLNNQAVAGNADATKIIADDKNILKSNVKYNNPSIKDDSALDNKTTSFSTANVDIAVATDNTNHQWRWNNEEATQSIKDNANLNNKVVALSAGNSKVANSVTDNRKVSAIIQSIENEWELAKNNNELNIQNYNISNIEKTATVKNAYNAEQTTIDKKLSWISSEEEKYNVTLDNKETTTVKAYLTTTTTENDKQKWKWDNGLKDSSVKDKVLLKNQTETSALSDSVTAANSKSEIKHEIENKILNDQDIVILNNSEIASVETDITSLPDFKYDKQEWDWANKDNDQSVRNNDKSNSEIDSLDKVNRNAAKASASSKDTWKWTSEGKVSSNKSNYLTANKTDLSSEASVKAIETTKNLTLFNLHDKNENSSIKKEIISNSKAAAFAGASTNSHPATDKNKNEWEKTQCVKDYIIYNNKTTELDEVNVKDTTNIAHDNGHSKLDEKESDSNKTIESTQANIDLTASLEKNKKKLGSDNNNKTERINDDVIINDAAAASAASNSSISIIVSNKKISWSENENDNSSVNNKFNNKEVRFTKDNTDAATALENNKKQGKSNNNNITQDVKGDFSINNQANAIAANNANATAIITSKNQKLKSDVKNNLTINDQATATVASNTNATATIIRDKQQLKLDDKNNNLNTKNNTASNKKGIWYAEDNTDVSATSENNKKQWKSDNSTTQSVKDDLIINNLNASSVENNANAASAIVLDKQQSRLSKESNDSSVNKNKSLNKIEFDSAVISNDSKISTEIDKQQSKVNNESNDSSIRNDFTSSNKEAKSAEANSNAKLTTENDKEHLELNNKEKVLDNINKNSRLKVNITSNSEETTSTIRTDIEAESKVILTKNNDSRKIFDEKALEVSTLEPISEKSSSTIDTTDINLENMGKDSLSNYNINDKEAQARIDVISDLMTNISATSIVKDSSARENKKISTDEIAGKSESNIFEVQTDNINETKGKFQSLELKNNNSNQYNHSIVIAGASASAHTEKVSNSLKESNSKLFHWNDDNKKDSIDEITNTKAIAYNVNKGDVDTLIKDNTKVPELKIKGENVQSHQNLVSTTAEAKAKSIIRAENKELNKQVKNYTFNNDHSITNVKANTSAAVEVKVDPSYPDTEIIKNSLKNTKASVLAYVKSEIDSVERSDDKKFEKNICNKDLTNNTNLRAGIETKAESNSVSMSNGINKRIEGRYNEEKDSAMKGTIDGKSDNLVITSSKEKEIINNLDKTSNDLINWLLRWKSISNVVESNKNERQNDTKIENRKSKSSYDEKHTIDQFATTDTLIDDKTKDTEKKIEKMDDADLIILKKPYGQQDTIGVTFIKDSVPPMILFRVIPKSLFEQVRKLIKEWEIVRVSYAEPQI
ncbi:hypothetical protein M0804_005389 [Polistes exclamans]|nr:hypothetical protein M0804_005389 [Polistes exclamans]